VKPNADVMKKSILILVLVSAIATFWHSCSRTEQKGTLKFGLEFTDNGELKSSLAYPDVTSALVTITGETGEVIFEKEPLTLYRFGEEYVTESLTLPVGRYRLSEFMLADTVGAIRWATPVEGSDLARLVRHPLPVPFSISYEQTTSLDIEVVRVDDYSPADFGYVRFPITFVERFCLKVFYSFTGVDWNNDSIPGPDGSFMPVYPALLHISAGGRQVLHEPMNPGLNNYTVPLVDNWYKLTATDIRGEQFYEEQFPVEELLKHRCAEDNPPLVIYHAADTGIIVTPEGLREPTIAQGVFGTITVPVDDTIMTGEYDFAPVVYDIYFYPYVLMDSLWAGNMGPIDCYFPIEMFQVDPVAIVRSNSEGYFQAPLDAGEYLYLVKTENGFYFDAYISSHLPGKVVVYPGQVTTLNIHVIDCSMWM
jgi:hypothetical protein